VLDRDEQLETVLVVDDDERSRALLHGYLKATYHVIAAEDGAAAMGVLGREAVDLVLLDVMMPGMSGFEVCRLIKAMPRDSFLPVLLLTALSDQADRNTGLAMGADDFLTKPVDRRELLLRVGAFLRIRRQEAVIARQVAELRKLGALKDDLISLLVHDLRSPLTGLLMTLETIRQEERDPALLEDLAEASRGAARIKETIEDMLEVRLLEDGEVPLRREPCSAGALAREAAAAVAGDARGRDIRVEVEVEAAGDATLLVDRKLVCRAVENVLSNGLRYSPHGGTIDVAVTQGPEGCAIEISDRGRGIPEDIKRKLFEKFVSTESMRGSERRGYGLGLYFVKLVLVAHGGSVSVRDRDQGGTVFRLFLPPGTG
jgi:signal transduction histidine kinase